MKYPDGCKFFNVKTERCVIHKKDKLGNDVVAPPCVGRVQVSCYMPEEADVRLGRPDGG